MTPKLCPHQLNGTSTCCDMQDWLRSSLSRVEILFFSSRRRHTRFDCDWSSDVCSSDLGERTLRDVFLYPFEVAIKEGGARSVMPSYNEVDGIPSHANRWLLHDVLREIGRASCRERG